MGATEVSMPSTVRPVVLPRYALFGIRSLGLVRLLTGRGAAGSPVWSAAEATFAGARPAAGALSLRRIAVRLGQPVDGASMAFFRAGFGVLMAVNVVRWF